MSLDNLTALEPLIGGYWHVAIVFFRVSALVSVLPAFGASTLPTRIKLVAAFSFTAIVAPAVPTVPEPEGLAGLALFAVAEATIGLAMGLGIRLLVLALQTAGSIAGQSTSLSQIFGTAGMDPIPAMGQVLVFAALALAIFAGLHIRAAEFLILSYDMLPIGQFPDPAGLSQWGIRQIARSFSLAFVLAVPFVITAVIYNLALGAINRAMPQMMVAFVGAPLITFGGLFLLFVASPMLLTVWIDALMGFFENPVRMN